MVIAAIFWLKARGRWKETSVNEHSGLDGKPIEQVHEIRRIILRAPDPAALGETPAGTPPANVRSPSGTQTRLNEPRYRSSSGKPATELQGGGAGRLRA
ncbi:hypothetical protein X737_37195 [Mesorhizobium sp. L48C026A00]|nr:hypothetical protein X737_37195 [Mesorhizobium sp. L48C026A00]